MPPRRAPAGRRLHIQLNGVGHQFDGHAPLFRNLTIRLVGGHVYALTGPSGSGKSTLMSILAGWVPPTEGVVERVQIGRIYWVFQNPFGVPGRSALDHVVLPYLARGISRTEAELHARRQLRAFSLESVALESFKSLSGGEAQRLMLARGMASAPDLFLVDEPTAQLDARTAETVIDSLDAMRTDRTIVVVATHDPRTRDRCTDSIQLGDFQ